jgi:hypothetical protein
MSAPTPQQPDLDPIVRATGATFRYLAQWFGDEEQRAALLEMAEAAEHLDDDMTCPVCEEMTCDEGCPLEPVRSRMLT